MLGVLHEHMAVQGVSIEELAEHSGMPDMRVRSILSGEVTLTLGMVERLSQPLGIRWAVMGYTKG